MATSERIEFRVSPEVKKALTTAASKENRSLSNFLLTAAFGRIEQNEKTSPAGTPAEAPKAVKKVAEKLQSAPTPVAKVEPPEEEEFFDDGYEHHWEHEGVQWRGSEGIAQRFDGKRWITDNTDPTTTYEDYGNDWIVDRI